MPVTPCPVAGRAGRRVRRFTRRDIPVVITVVIPLVIRVVIRVVIPLATGDDRWRSPPISSLSDHCAFS